MTNQYPRNWHKYDLCLKCPLINDDISDEVVVFVNKLSKIIGGQYIYGFISEYDGRFTILLRAGSKFVLNKGIQESWELPLDPDICNIIAKNGNESYFIDPFTINHVPTISSIPPFHYIYAKYKTDPSIQHLYSCKLNGVSPFSKMMRVKMLMDLLKNNSMIDHSDAHVESRIDDRENNDVLLEFTISRLLYRGTVKDVFAIHDFSEIALLRDRIYPIRWLTSLPLDLIRDYFGESIAFDVAFFEYLFFCMYIIAIVGVAIQFLTIFYNDFYSIPELPPFAFFIPFYFIFAIQRWKRQEQIFAMKWNTRKQLEPINLERLNHNNYVRNDFQGKLLYSPVNGEVIIYYSHSMKTFCKFFLGCLLSILILTLCIIGTLISYAGIYYARYKLRQINSISFYVQYIASGGNAFISILYNQIFGFIAYQITGLENHRTDENYEFSYTVKMILFQLVSTLASFYYLAFAAAYVQKHGETVSSVGECGYDNCMFPVSINAMVFVFMEGLCRLFTQFLLPYFRIQLSAMLHRRRYRFVREKEREIVDLESSAVNGMKPIVKKLIVPDSTVQENDPNHNDYRDISEDFQHLNDQFEQVNPVKPDQLKHVMEVIRLQSPTTQSRNDDWIDQLKPKAPESVDQENIDIDLNEDIFPPSRENVDRFTRVKFFDSGDDESQSEQHNLHNSELEQNSTLEMPKSPRLEISTASEKNQGDGFSSAGELTPPPSPLASQYRSPKSRRKSNLNVFYHEFPLSNDDDNFIQSSEIESKDESSENGRILRDQDVHVSHQDFHRVEYDVESDEEDEEQSRFYSKRAPFERFSSVSYQAQFHHLNNHLFVFRLMTIALCFGAALPGIFGLMLIIFFVDLRVQLWQLMDFYPRNLPLVTSSIGWVWIIAYDALLIASAGTNASLIIFTIESSGYSHWQLIHRMLLWIGIVFFLLILQLFTSFIFQRIPKEVKIQNRRSHIIVRKLIDRIPDRLDSLPVEML